jgi:DNA polymerase (family 10)
VEAAWKELGATDVADLEQACRDGRLAGLPRQGAKRAQNILQAIARYRARSGRTPIARALPYAQALVARLARLPGVEQVEAAGSLRRRAATVGDLDLVASAKQEGPVTEAFTRFPEVAQVLALGPTRATVRLPIGLQVDLRVVPPDSFGAALTYLTGSKDHGVQLRTRAVRLGLKISEYGVFTRSGRRLGGATEEEVYRAVGLPWIPPELREGLGELEIAEAGGLPKLVEEGDLQGDLHVHSDASLDAHSDLFSLAQQARKLGRRYLAITDHSRGRPRGLDAQRLLEHAQAIRALDRRLPKGPRLLAGVEVDIRADGSLDLPLSALAQLDLVVASVHSRFSDPRERMTGRPAVGPRGGR